MDDVETESPPGPGGVNCEEDGGTAALAAIPQIQNHFHASSRLLEKKELAEMLISTKYEKETYMLRLELETANKEKKAAEDRLDEMYQDLQDDSLGGKFSTNRGALALDADYVAGLHGQIEKYERLMRVMGNQIQLVRSSGDAVSKSLKEEISDLVEEKCRAEMELMSKCAELQNKNALMQRQLISLQTTEQQNHELQDHTRVSLSPRVSDSLKAPESTRDARCPPDDGNTEKQELIARIERLKKALAREKRNTLECQAKSRLEKASLLNQISSLQKDMLVIQSTSEVAAQVDREETLQWLNRVSMIWDKAHEAIANVESVIMELNSHYKEYESSSKVDEDRERLLSTLETVSLVHGQVKVSLMLIELKLQNNLASLKSDTNLLSANMSNENTVSTDDRMKAIRDEAMAAIRQVESVLNKHMEKLDVHAKKQAKAIQTAVTLKLKDLDGLCQRQKDLEEEVSKFRGANPNAHFDNTEMETSDLFVSRDVLVRLQGEVLDVAKRVREKNETIFKLQASIKELKAREVRLADALNRVTGNHKEQLLSETVDSVDGERDRDQETMGDTHLPPPDA